MKIAIILLITLVILISGCAEISENNCVLKDVEDCCGIHRECFFEDEQVPAYEDEICEGGICIKKQCRCADPSTLPKATACELENNECKTIYEPKEPVECILDSDCGTGGCSGQLCGEKDEIKGIMTTCEYRESYSCFELTNCGCVDGNCEWRVNSAYLDCLEEFQ